MTIAKQQKDGVRILPSGDSALIVEFGDAIDLAISEQVLQLRHGLSDAPPVGMTETVPTYRSLLVLYDPLATSFADISDEIRSTIDTVGARPFECRHWHVPVCYEDDFAPDLAYVAEQSGYSVEEVIKVHSGVLYHTYMLGFIAGYPYLGDLPKRLSLPRRKDPRVRVPPGSIAIALTMTGIYPVESPGGWHLIGMTPIKIFDTSWPQPALFAPGDKISFEPVTAAEYERIEKAVAADTYKVPHDLVAA